jgi:hypothetical protein
VVAEHRVAHELDTVVQRVISPRICAQRGWLSGKNVPATRNSGVSTALTTYLKFSNDEA